MADNAVDQPGCRSKASPCRSISQAIANAMPGDEIVVGPGAYGDLNGDGSLSLPGEENGAPGCACMLASNKAVSLTSSDGAAAAPIQP